MKILIRILLRWAANALGLWIAGRLLLGVNHGDHLATIIIAGLFLSIINNFIKPFVVMLSLPAIVLTLGLFTIIINGFMVWLTAEIMQNFSFGELSVEGFGAAVLAGLIIGLVNYVVTILIEKRFL